MISVWTLAGSLLLALLAWYLSFSASRLDRLHHRVEAARAVLDTQLVRRAEAALELATSGRVDAASGLLLADAASRALEAGESADNHESPDHRGVAGGARREQAESDLSRVLRAAVGGLDPESDSESGQGRSDRGLDVAAGQSAGSRHDQLEDDQAGGLGALALDRVAVAAHRVQLARRFLNGAVTDVLRLRRKRIVRWVRLAGRALVPDTFEMDDEPPPELTR
ncbi:MAG: hypothetical protein ACRC35_10145 [Angustibacter sp.]